ncbi:MAG: N-acetylneuraminate synthase family protein [Deltaproteobacteria bacterium]|nr:N-acetylneuraminate synthase family protein [Deltaproteobacteria bacterium]
MREIFFNGVRVADDTDAYVIAEIGHNHQGNVETAKSLFKSAKECGAHAVKLQKRNNRTLFTKALYDSPYTGENSYGDTYGAHREALELGESEYRELQAYAKELGLTMFATAFDFESADFLERLDMPIYKIASGDLTNTPLLKHIAAFGKPMILSTGGGTMDDIQKACDTVMSINPQLCILQCTACYPVEDYADMNLRVISTLRRSFPTNVIGLSDHESGISMALVAYTLGARVIEKHFTLNRSWRGTDHAFSLAPVGLRRLVRDLKRARKAMGDGVKRRLPREEKPLFKMRKKIVAARDLPAGHVLTRNDVALKSPGDGLPPFELDRVLGRTLKVRVSTDQNITFENLE